MAGMWRGVNSGSNPHYVASDTLDGVFFFIFSSFAWKTGSFSRISFLARIFYSYFEGRGMSKTTNAFFPFAALSWNDGHVGSVQIRHHVI